MPAATYYLEIDLEFFGAGLPDGGFAMLEVASSVPSAMSAIGFQSLVGALGWAGTWYDPPLNASTSNATRYIVKQTHTPSFESTEIGGAALNFNPSLNGGYVPYMAGLQAQFFLFGFLNQAPDMHNIGGNIYSIKMGSVPGGDDLLRWNALDDGFGPFTVFGGMVNLVGDHLEFPAPNGGLIEWNFLAPWPPALTFRCSFSVGITRNNRSTPNLPPPDDTIFVQAALPETLLPEGYRVEFGTYTPAGVARPGDSVTDATVAFSSLEDDDE